MFKAILVVFIMAISASSVIGQDVIDHPFTMGWDNDENITVTYRQIANDKDTFSNSTVEELIELWEAEIQEGAIPEFAVPGIEWLANNYLSIRAEIAQDTVCMSTASAMASTLDYNKFNVVMIGRGNENLGAGFLPVETYEVVSEMMDSISVSFAVDGNHCILVNAEFTGDM